MTASSGNISFVSLKSQDSLETKQMFPSWAVIKCIMLTCFWLFLEKKNIYGNFSLKQVPFWKHVYVGAYLATLLVITIFFLFISTRLLFILDNIFSLFFLRLSSGSFRFSSVNISVTLSMIPIHSIAYCLPLYYFRLAYDLLYNWVWAQMLFNFSTFSYLK